MMNYLVVIHQWFMDSEKWETHEIEVVDETAAHEKASQLTYSQATSLRRRAYTLVRIEPGMVVIPPTRKLTFWERLTGRVNVSQ